MTAADGRVADLSSVVEQLNKLHVLFNEDDESDVPLEEPAEEIAPPLVYGPWGDTLFRAINAAAKRVKRGKTSKRMGVTIFFSNITSLSKEASRYLADCEADILCLAETHVSTK